MVVTILGAELRPAGTVVTLSERVKRTFAYVPGARQFAPANTLLFPYQYSIPDILEALRNAIRARPTVEFVIPDDLPVVKTLRYEKLTYSNVNTDKIRRLKETVDTISHTVSYAKR